ncbi:MULTISPECIES: AAA family ATPase [Pseudanabaena]|uniref:Endonuclease GajA/Old nuclease/RecF-like AAA domain-containing protein n=2 Tax=Pseudanabaena TaxID=1152 RepID=L8N359_9CYAN|nr:MULTISPECIES: AAA family ATPase [Pseudanabaena]ELS34116.1 hypothetical protein Pse7429DRAFT_0789 [Pseudanabaena biceps PCC 7429]MDG3493705.1 AAA family ATPase [Pseudanabaena catenata USMAC16]
MLKEIVIKNFRCFDNLKVSGFGRVNLISGKNNAGKTALLEAIFLNSAPRSDTVYLLRQVRREQVSFSKALPERTWTNFFFEQNENNRILIEAILENGDSKAVDIFIEESLRSMLVQDSYQTDAIYVGLVLLCVTNIYYKIQNLLIWNLVRKLRQNAVCLLVRGKYRATGMGQF